MTEEEKAAQAKKDFLSLRSGGAYVPPARLRALQASIPQDKKSEDFQRLAHDARKKSVNGLINKLNVGNIRSICEESFNENLFKARGLLCQSLLKAQAASLTFTPVYAAYVAVISSKLPIIGELLQNRLINRWAKAFRRNDKAVCISSTLFLAHLCNQDVISYIVPANMLQMLLEKPSDDSVEIAVNLMRELGQHLEEANMPIANLLFDRLRQILQESNLEKRTLYAIEVLFLTRRQKYENNPAIPENLDIVPDDDRVTLEALPPDQWVKADPENSLNIFKYDPEYETNEANWKKMRDEIFGEDSDDEDSDSGAGSEESESEESDEEARAQDVKDLTADELVQLRRRIYLTITSSSAFEEATHKLMKVPLPIGKEQELPQMLVETCSQRPTYEKFFGFIGQRLCEIRRDMRDEFEKAFAHYYDSIHRYDSNRLRAIAQFFAHLLGTEAIGWYVFQSVILTEEDTTSSSRIFIMILFQGMVEEMGMVKLQAKFRDSTLQPYFTGLFPLDDQKNTRFAINYFTSIQMGAITEDMREALANMPKAPALPAIANGNRSHSRSTSERSFSSSYYSYSGSSRSRSESRSSRDTRSPPPRRDRGRSPPRGRSYSRSVSSSRSRTPSYSRSRSPPRRERRRSPSLSRSRSPPRRTIRQRSPSLSRSRSPPRRSARRSPSYSRSRTPPRRGARRYSSYSRSRSPPRRPVQRRSPSYSRSRSPPPRRRSPALRRERSPPMRQRPPVLRRSRSPPRRRRSLSYERNRSPSRRRRS